MESPNDWIVIFGFLIKFGFLVVGLAGVLGFVLAGMFIVGWVMASLFESDVSWRQFSFAF